MSKKDEYNTENVKKVKEGVWSADITKNGKTVRKVEVHSISSLLSEFNEREVFKLNE